MPHFGDCTQEGHPSVQLQLAMASRVAAELRERVRERIREALDELESPGSQDPLLQELIRSINNRVL